MDYTRPITSINPGSHLHLELVRIYQGEMGATYEYGDNTDDRWKAQEHASSIAWHKRLNDPMVRVGLCHVELQQEQDHVNVEMFLTTYGENALGALNKGVVWNVTKQHTEHHHSYVFWERYLKGRSLSDDVIKFLQASDHQVLKVLKQRLTYELLVRERKGKFWFQQNEQKE